MTDRGAELAERIAERARERELTVVTAESLTSGSVAAALGAAPGGISWFRGGLVAYQDDVKHGLLDVEEGPVVTDSCARQMAVGAARLLGADVAVAATGAGGPDPQDDQPPGTVFVAVHTADGVRCREHHFDGDPAAVVQRSVEASLALLLEALGERGEQP